MGVEPAEILREQDPDAIPAEAPPAAANYREADVAGIACAFCSKFTYTGVVEEDGGWVPTGVCEQWEATVRGDHVSDAFADPSPPLDEDGNEVWDFSESDRVIHEIHLAGSGEAREEDGLVIKDILRTGEWDFTPTGAGMLKKKLRIVRDGRSDPKEGVIALSELVDNFNAGVVQRVQIPLSDEQDDHKNITRLNTGFVKKLWIDDRAGTSYLVAGMAFTEPEVKDKALRGTYADVSCGIPWNVRKRGNRYGAVLEHVCLTNSPFIDGLGPFLAASNQFENVDISHYVLSDRTETEPSDEAEEQDEHRLSLSQILHGAEEAIPGFGLNASSYRPYDVQGSKIFIRNDDAATAWTATYTTEAEDDDVSIVLSPPTEWEVVEEEEKDESPAPTNGSAPHSSDDGLEAARCLREIRLSQPVNTKKEEHMPLTREELDRLELSDDQRAAIQNVLDENASLRSRTREQEADRRVDELKGLGLSERPGALKLYRQVFLSDDGGPAIVLMSDNGQEKERLTALEVLDRFIESVKGSDGKVVLSDQALASGNDDPPPATAEGEQEKPLEERVSEAKQALGLTK